MEYTKEQIEQIHDLHGIDDGDIGILESEGIDPDDILGVYPSAADAGREAWNDWYGTPVSVEGYIDFDAFGEDIVSDRTEFTELPSGMVVLT